MQYDYNKLCKHSDLLTKRFNFIQKSSIGKSVLNKDIICLKLGNGKNSVIVAAAFHALEYLTSAVLIKFLFNFSTRLRSGKDFFGFDTTQIFNSISFYALPMINPDGIDIVLHGLDFRIPQHRIIADTLKTCDLQNTWQANANGVDLNHNYNALWKPVMPGIAPGKYSGPFPESEPETHAVVSFTNSIQPNTVLALHSQGEEIYYDFNNEIPKGAYSLAKKMSVIGGYKVCSPSGTASFGGYKDWFISKYHKKGYTIEIGKGKNPLSYLDSVYPSAARIMLCILQSCADC